MTGDGRPLRFLALVASGWIAIRVLIVWQATGSLPQALRDVVPPPLVEAAARPLDAPPSVRAAWPRLASPPAAGRWARASIARPVSSADPAVRGSDPVSMQFALLGMARFGAPLPLDEERQPAVPQPASVQILPPAGRNGWSLSAWAIARSGNGAASADRPQLGGSQIGARLDYALGRGFALTGRVAAPARGVGREAALGIAWQPARVPLRIVAEHRVALDRGRGGPGVGIATGVSDVQLPARFRLESYGQAGVVFRDRHEPYADGLVRATRPVTPDLALGAGAWGGAQRGVARLDVGPTAGMRLPAAGSALRVSLDWRQRIAGNARPGSGPAISLGADF